MALAWAAPAISLLAMMLLRAAASSAAVPPPGKTPPDCDEACARAAQAQPDVSSLLQVGLASVATRRAAQAPAPSGPPADGSQLRCADPAGYPDVGPPYVAEQVPLLKMMESICTAPEPGCKDPHRSDLTLPIVEVAANLKPGELGYCHFDFFPMCMRSVRLESVFTFGLAMSYVVKLPQPKVDGAICQGGYQKGDMRTAPGTFALDAELCYSMGWLDLPRELLGNFTAMAELGGQQCEALKREFADEVGNLTMAREEASFGSRTRMSTGGNDAKDWRRHEAAKCLLWDTYSMACDMSICMYNFCRLPDGRVGAGLQCRPDWLNAYDVAALDRLPPGLVKRTGGRSSVIDLWLHDSEPTFQAQRL